MSLLLISVKNLYEIEMINSFTNIIDLKNPNLGPLGSWNEDQIIEARKLLNEKNKLSATLGNLRKNEEIANKLIKFESFNLDFIKIGIFEDSVARMFETLNLIYSTQIKTKIVIVLFAENKNLIEYLYKNMLNLKKIGLNFILIDTMNKKSKDLVHNFSLNFLKKLIEKGEKNELKIGLAGKVKIHQVKKLVTIKPYLIGVRGGVCERFERRSSISKNLVIKLSNYLNLDTNNAHEAAGA